MRNIISYRKSLLFALLTLLPFAQASAANEATGYAVLGGTLLFAVLFVVMVLHMGYVLFKGKSYKQEFTADYFREKRKLKIETLTAAKEKAEQDAQDPKNAGKEQPVIVIPETDPTDEEVEQCYALLEEAFDYWTVISGAGEEELRTPTKMKQIRKSKKALDKVIDLCPYEETVINRLNELCHIINVSEERSFNGSKMLIWISVIVGVVGAFLSKSWEFPTFLASGLVLYWVASRTPQFLIEKRAERGGGNIFSGLIGGAFAAVATAKTYKTVTKWSDGTTTTDYDNSETWISIVIAVVICVVLACLLYFWAMLNYLRNYVFYF